MNQSAQTVPFANMQSIPYLLKGRVEDYRIDEMVTLKGGRPEFHPTRGFTFRKHIISLGDEGVIVIEDFGYHTEITCVPTAGMPKLFKIVYHVLKCAGVNIIPYVYTKATDLIKVEI
jgi:hypothetical protein